MGGKLTIKNVEDLQLFLKSPTLKVRGVIDVESVDGPAKLYFYHFDSTLGVIEVTYVYDPGGLRPFGRYLLSVASFRIPPDEFFNRRKILWTRHPLWLHHVPVRVTQGRTKRIPATETTTLQHLRAAEVMMTARLMDNLYWSSHDPAYKTLLKETINHLHGLIRRLNREIRQTSRQRLA